MPKQNFSKTFTYSIIILLVLIAGGYLVYPYISTRIAIRSAIKETIQRVSPEDYSKLKKIKIEMVHPTINPFEYWVSLTKVWKDNDTKEYRKQLYFVNIEDKNTVSLADLGDFTKVASISDEKIVLINNLNPDVNPRWKKLTIYRSDEGKPNWTLTALSDYNQEIGGLHFHFRNINEQYASGDDYLYPLFDGDCENDTAADKFMISLSGVQLKNKYNSNRQNVYFQHSIKVECKEYEDPFTGKEYIQPVNNSLNYIEPYIITSLPGGITLKIDAQQLRTGTEKGWANPETLLQAFQDDTKINFQTTSGE